MVAAVGNQELGIADVARKEKAEDLAPTIRKIFVAEPDPFQDQINGIAAAALLDHIFVSGENSPIAANDVERGDIATAEGDQFFQFFDDCIHCGWKGRWSGGAPGDKTDPR